MPGLASERGAALVVALLATAVLAALGGALILATSTESAVAANFRGGREALYAAEAAAELALAELRTAANLAALLDGTERSRFTDGEGAGPRPLPIDAPVDLSAVLNLANCGTPGPCAGPPRWRLFLHAPLGDLLPAAGGSPFYVVALVGPGTPRPGGAPGAALRAEAFGPRGASRAIEAVLALDDPRPPGVVQTRPVP